MRTRSPESESRWACLPSDLQFTRPGRPARKRDGAACGPALARNDGLSRRSRWRADPGDRQPQPRSMAESSPGDVDRVLKTMAQTIIDNAVYRASLTLRGGSAGPTAEPRAMIWLKGRSEERKRRRYVPCHGFSRSRLRDNPWHGT